MLFWSIYFLCVVEDCIFVACVGTDGTDLLRDSHMHCFWGVFGNQFTFQDLSWRFKVDHVDRSEEQ